MDARRFDGLARTLARGRSRRGILRGLAGLTAGGFLTRAAIVRADGGDGTGQGIAGGGTATGACIPVASPVSQLASIKPPFPALITAGSCETPDAKTTYSLFDVSTAGPPVGAATAAAVYQSATTVRVILDDLLKQTYSIVVQVSKDDHTVVVCGEIGGLRTGDDLTVGLRERNGSAYTGIGWLRGSGASTLVYVFLGHGLSTIETAAAATGSTVVTTADVNLRAGPSADADVVAVVPKGTKLTVTGAASGEWLPVKNPGTGDVGFVSSQYLTLSS
jgi:hypothetical protein